MWWAAATYFATSSLPSTSRHLPTNPCVQPTIKTCCNNSQIQWICWYPHIPSNKLSSRASRFAPDCNLTEKDVNFTPHLSFPYLESDSAAFSSWQKLLSTPAMIAWGGMVGRGNILCWWYPGRVLHFHSDLFVSACQCNCNLLENDNIQAIGVFHLRSEGWTIITGGGIMTKDDYDGGSGLLC